MSILKTQVTDRTVKEICHEIGISNARFYNWKAKYGGMEVNDVVCMKDLQDEKARSKRIVSNLSLEIDAVKTILKKVRRSDDKREAVKLLVRENLSVRQTCKLVLLPRSAMTFKKCQGITVL